jgi:RHS repeat-associated protein
MSGGGRSYTWTADNLPASVTSGGVTETYLYDADGERVAKTVGSTTTVYFQGIWEQIAGGASKLYYTFNGQVVAMRDTSTNAVTYLHGDHLGSVSLATNSSGAVMSKQDFDPWGKARGASTIAQTSLNYTGQRLDGTGLLYYHARYYDPALARFVSADSVVPGQSYRAGAANPQQLNRYSYVDNNPLTYNDPTGHSSACPECTAGAGAGPGEDFEGGPGGGVSEPAVAPEAESIAQPVAEPVAGKPLYEPMQSPAAQAKGEEAGMPAERAPDFVVTENGDVIPVPDGATGPKPVETGKGFQYTGGGTGVKGSVGKGLDGRVSAVRIMDPTEPKGKSPGYPDGYVSYSNSASPKPQPVDPYTGQTVSRSEWHIPLRGPQ